MERKRAPILALTSIFLALHTFIEFSGAFSEKHQDLLQIIIDTFRETLKIP